MPLRTSTIIIASALVASVVVAIVVVIVLVAVPALHTPLGPSPQPGPPLECLFYPNLALAPTDAGDGCYGYESCAYQAVAHMTEAFNFSASHVLPPFYWKVKLESTPFFSSDHILARTDHTNGQGLPQVTSFNRDFPWYFGSDGDCPDDRYDCVSVAMHEMAHAMWMLNHIPDDCLMPPTRNPGETCHGVTPADVEVLRRFYVPTGYGLASTAAVGSLPSRFSLLAAAAAAAIAASA